MLKIGHKYEVNHSRKGRFFIRVTEDNDAMVTGIITDGVARSIITGNETEKGEEITVRKSFYGFKLIEER